MLSCERRNDRHGDLMDRSEATATHEDVAAHAKAARGRRRAEAAKIGIDREFVALLVDDFYARVREDDLLRPIFDGRISDWPTHLGRMRSFWGSILMNSNEVSAHHMVATHLALPDIGEAHFARWLTLFYATLRDLERHPDATRLVGDRARRIAESLVTAIATRDHGVRGIRAGADLPRV